MRSFVRSIERHARRIKRRVAGILRQLADARQRRRLQEIEFHRSLNRYRRSIGLPTLRDDDPIQF
jgi:hypothetical protein